MNPITSAAPRRYTADDLLAMGPDVRYELDEGELIEMNPTNPWHGSVENRTASRLNRYLEDHPIGLLMTGDVGFKLGEDLMRAPDIAFLTYDRIRAVPIPRKGWYPGAPELAAEVLSPDDRPGMVLRKVSRFLDAGTRLVWVVDPERTLVTVYRPDGRISLLQAEDTLSGEDVLPGFECRVQDLFPSLEPPAPA